MSDYQEQQSEVEQPQRRGIMPFREGFTKSVTNDGETFTSPEISMGALGRVEAQIYKPNEGVLDLDREVFTLDADGKIITGNGEELLKKGYGQLLVYVSPNKEADFDEMDKKGEIDTLVWFDEDSLMRSELVREADNSTSINFKPEGSELEPKDFFLRPDESVLRDFQVSFEKHRGLTGGDTE